MFNSDDQSPSPDDTSGNYHSRLAHNIDEVSDVSGSGRTKIYEEIKAGRLKARKLGRRTLVLDHDLRDWLNSLPLAESKAR